MERAEGPLGTQPRGIRRGVCSDHQNTTYRPRPAQTTPKITIFTDAQAAIKRMQTLEVGPGQIFALQARRILAEIDCSVEIRWCPAHEGIAGNEEADQWAKIAAGKPHERGVE